MKNQITIGEQESYQIDIVVPVYKNEQLTKCCVDSILAHISELDAYDPRVILVNDSPDYTPINNLLKN